MHTAVNDSYRTFRITQLRVTGSLRCMGQLPYAFFMLRASTHLQAELVPGNRKITARCPQKGQKHEDDHGRGYQGDHT